MSLEYQILIALLLDLLFGDPRWLPHPVKIMGGFALALEPSLRRMIPSPREAGIVAAVMVIGLSGLVAWGLVRLAGLIHPWAADAVSIVLIYTSVAARDLADHSSEVLRALAAGNLSLAKKRVSWMVGRDTERMDEQEIARAAVESVAENTVDGVIAPLLYAFLFGPVGAIVYKAINTLDSTFGYKNERYIDFGWCSAKVDDLANWLPARLTVWLIAAGALLLGMRPMAAIHISRRDGRQHASPNSGLSEAAMAGALGIQLGGPVWRKGRLDPMPFMGDPVVRLERSHIRKANALMFATTIIAVTTGMLLLKGVRTLS
jgi:adenosylcobinamide-phosphate synthase